MASGRELNGDVLAEALAEILSGQRTTRSSLRGRHAELGPESTARRRAAGPAERTARIAPMGPPHEQPDDDSAGPSGPAYAEPAVVGKTSAGNSVRWGVNFLKLAWDDTGSAEPAQFGSWNEIVQDCIEVGATVIRQTHQADITWPGLVASATDPTGRTTAVPTTAGGAIEALVSGAPGWDRIEQLLDLLGTSSPSSNLVLTFLTLGGGGNNTLTGYDISTPGTVVELFTNGLYLPWSEDYRPTAGGAWGLLSLEERNWVEFGLDLNDPKKVEGMRQIARAVGAKLNELRTEKLSSHGYDVADVISFVQIGNELEVCNGKPASGAEWGTWYFDMVEQLRIDAPWLRFALPGLASYSATASDPTKSVSWAGKREFLKRLVLTLDSLVSAAYGTGLDDWLHAVDVHLYHRDDLEFLVAYLIIKADLEAGLQSVAALPSETSWVCWETGQAGVVTDKEPNADEVNQAVSVWQRLTALAAAGFDEVCWHTHMSGIAESVASTGLTPPNFVGLGLRNDVVATGTSPTAFTMAADAWPRQAWIAFKGLVREGGGEPTVLRRWPFEDASFIPTLGVSDAVPGTTDRTTNNLFVIGLKPNSLLTSATFASTSGATLWVVFADPLESDGELEVELEVSADYSPVTSWIWYDSALAGTSDANGYPERLSSGSPSLALPDVIETNPDGTIRIVISTKSSATWVFSATDVEVTDATDSVSRAFREVQEWLEGMRDRHGAP